MWWCLTALIVENIGKKLDVSNKVNIWGTNIVHFQFPLLTDVAPSSFPQGLADFLSPLFSLHCNELKSRLDFIYFPAFFSHFFKLHFSSLLVWRQCPAPSQKRLLALLGCGDSTRGLHNFSNYVGEKSALRQLLPSLSTMKHLRHRSCWEAFLVSRTPLVLKLWWGLLGLCSLPEPVRTWEQPVCLSRLSQ